MSTINAEQIAEWNGTAGQRWAELQAQTDDIVVPFGAAALQLAGPHTGERVIDIGCGCGDTSIELARLVGSTGHVLGVDVSQPMLAVARKRACEAGCSNVTFSESDASEAALPTDQHLLFSRFGVMFFGQPTLAFQHLRASLQPDGRAVFVCWRTPRDNPWAMIPLVAARNAMGITPAPTDPFAPGPFAFADEQRLRTILSEAGFVNIQVQRFDAPILLGTTPRVAAENVTRIGPTARFAHDAGIEHLPTIITAVESALTPLAEPNGQVHLNGSTWLVSASNP